MMKKHLGIILGILAAVIIVVLVILLVVSYGRKPDTGTAAATASPGMLSSASASSETAATASNSDAAAGESAAQDSGSLREGQEKLVGSFIQTELPTLTESQKLELIDFENRMFQPIYHPVITLTTEAGLDSAGQTAAPWTSIVSPQGNQKKTFKLSFNENVSSQTSKIIWQVSLFPFDGKPLTASQKTGGLLLVGELPKGSTTFDVDFLKVYNAGEAFYHPAPHLQAVGSLTAGIQIAKPRGVLDALGKYDTVPLRTYYVRAYPVDSNGASIGDSGSGLPVIYGDPTPPKSTVLSPTIVTPVSKFSLMPAKKPGDISYGGEFPNIFVDESERLMYIYNYKNYSFRPLGYPKDTQKLILQVSLTDYTGAAAKDWNKVSGLVSQTIVMPSDAVFKDLSKPDPSYGISVDFSKFVPADSKLPEDDAIPYYVRTVALTDGAAPGTATAAFSETVVIKYSKLSKDIIIYQPVTVSPQIPVLEKLTYTPIRWESQNWQYHYVVTRQPTEKEVFMGIGSDEPYAAYPVGTKLDFTPVPEEKSWWEEAWDAITSFFGSLVDFIAKLVDWVSSAYNSLKSGLINIVVSAMPSSWQGSLQTALTVLADTGLASIGIPPSLPNFDDLASMGTDYLATVAMEQAGIPADSLGAYGLGELSGKISDALSASAQSASPNPMNWDFVKLDPDFVYRPAYITVDLYNPYSKPTPAGKLSFTASKTMDLSKNGFDPAVTYLYAAYGTSYVYLFKPVYGMEIPSLAPGQHLQVPVILSEYVGLPFPDCAAPVDSNSFRLMQDLGAFNFGVNITYDLPSAAEEAKNQGIEKPNAIYSYAYDSGGAYFTIDPSSSYSK